MKKNIIVFYLFTFLMMVSLPAGVRADTCSEHQWGDWRVESEATCISEGSRYHNCQICNAVEREPIPATGVHAWGEWLDLSEPSCMKDGLQRRMCKDCSETDSKSIPAIGHHSWDEWYHIYEPTCEYKGLKQRTCLVCSETEDKEIPKTQNHSWEEWKITKRATALSNGIKTRHCFECLKKETKSVPKLKAKISLQKKSVSIKKGKSYMIKIKSKTYGDKVKKWRSSNRKIAIVNQNGKVTAKREGIVTITLEMKSKAKATCRIKVTKPKRTKQMPPAQPSSVWLSATGSKYHRIPNCGTMNPSTARQVSLSEALGQGYGPCSKCF